MRLAKIGDHLDRSRLRQRGLLPDGVLDRRRRITLCLVIRPFLLLGSARLQPVLLGGCIGGRAAFEAFGQRIGDNRDVADQGRCVIVVRGVGDIAVDVDDMARGFVASARAIGLAHRA